MDATLVVGIVAVAVAIVIGGWQIRLAGPRHKHRSDGGEGVRPTVERRLRNAEIDGVVYRVRPHPLDIVKQVAALPFAQQDHAQSTYVGLTVRWHATLQAISGQSDGSSRLMLSGARGGYPWIHCSLDLSKRPEVAVAKPGQGFRVSGRITRVRGHDIHMEVVEVEPQ